MPSYNKVILVGHLTRNPEVRYTQNQTPVANTGLGINRRWKTQDGQEHDEVCFVDLTVWGSRAEAMAKYFKKGDPILVEGRLALERWTAKDGTNRQKLYVNVEVWRFVGSGNGNGDGQQAAAQDPYEAPQATAGFDPYATAGAPPADDDIPF